MNKLHSINSIEELAYKYANEFKKQIEELKLNNGNDFRRYYDGVSSEESLFLKLVAEILVDNKCDVRGLIQCQDEDPTPWCPYGHKTAKDCDCGPIADND